MPTDSADTESPLHANNLHLRLPPYGASLCGRWRAGPAASDHGYWMWSVEDDSGQTRYGVAR